MAPNTTAATQSAGAGAAQPQHPDPSPSGGDGLRPLLLAAAGGLVTAALVLGAVRSADTGQGAELGLDAVAQSQLNDAMLSLDSTQARAAVDDAWQCKAPLAFVTLVAAPGTAPTAIRIRSGSYLSPSIRITDSPRRVAVPFPAPYPSGQGVISVEGAARGLTVWLSPAWHIASLDGAAQRNVVWTPKKPC